MEIKSKVDQMEKIKNRIVFANDLIVPSRGHSGGVALLWAREVNLNINSYLGSHIDAFVKEPEGNFQ